MKAMLAAVGFLTIFPVPLAERERTTRLNESVAFFPVVGLLIGLVVATLDSVFRVFAPPLLASALIVVALAAVSGGLHLDGLADTADGFFSSRPREKILEIMRDSRTGPMGVTAIVCVVLVKFAAISSIGADTRWMSILLIPFAGRCALVIMLNLLPYARSQGGLATPFRREPSVNAVMWTAGILVVLGYLTLGSSGLAVAASSLAGTLLFAACSHLKIRGYTGDTLGATCEIAETIAAVTAACSVAN